MQNFRQQNGPTVTATPHVKPVTHGDSGTRSQSPSDSHSAVQRPTLPSGYVDPFGRSLPCGTRRQVREIQSRDGEATTPSAGAGISLPRSQLRPTGLLVHETSTSPTTTMERRPSIGADNKEADREIKRTDENIGFRWPGDPMLLGVANVRFPCRTVRNAARGECNWKRKAVSAIGPWLDRDTRHVDDFAAYIF